MAQVFDASYGQARDGPIGRVPPPAFASVKFLVTLGSYLSGIPGGLFGPSPN